MRANPQKQESLFFMKAILPKSKIVDIPPAACCENKSTETGKYFFLIKAKSRKSKTADIPSAGYCCHD